MILENCYMNKLNIVSVLALAFAAALVAGCGPKLPYKVVR